MLSFKEFNIIPLEEVSTKRGSLKVSVFQGRFSPPTKAHIDIIKECKLPVRIFIVEGSKSNKNKNPFSYELRKEMLEEILTSEGINFKIYKMGNGFIGNPIHILREENEEPIEFYCGSDRAETYQKQINNYSEKLKLTLEIKEIKRSEDSISASKVRLCLEDNRFGDFKTLTHKRMWHYYPKLQEEMELNIHEATYVGNLGLEELFKFYKEANDNEIDEMEKILIKNDWNAFKNLIKRVLGVSLK